MRHAGPVALPKRIAQVYREGQEGGGSEATAFSGRGGKGGNLKGVRRLWAHPQYGPILQVPGESDIDGGWWLNGSDPESDKGTGGLEEDDKDLKQGGGEAVGVRIFIMSCHPVGVDIWCRYVGGYPPYGTVPGGFQDQVARILIGKLPWRRLDRKWEYTSAEAEISEAGFEPMETYIQRGHNTVAQYIATRLLLDLCEAAERKQGEQADILWL